LQQRAEKTEIQNSVDKVTDYCENVCWQYLFDNSSLPDCDLSGSKLSAGVELPAVTELQRNGVNAALMRDAAEDSHLVVKSVVKTSAVQDEVTLVLTQAQQRSTVPRVHGSGGYSQTTAESGSTHWLSAAPLSDNQQYSFRYKS